MMGLVIVRMMPQGRARLASGIPAGSPPGGCCMERHEHLPHGGGRVEA